MPNEKKETKTTKAATATARIKTSLKFDEVKAGGADGAVWELQDGTYDVRILKQFKSSKGTELLATTQGMSTVKSIAYAASLNARATAALKDGDFFAFDPNMTFKMVISNKGIKSIVIKGDA